MATQFETALASAKPLVIGIIIGALGWWAALSWGFGWMSHGSARQLADQQTGTALVAALTPECMNRFEHQTDVLKAWQALKKASANFNQASFMKKGGWVVMKGQPVPSADTDNIANHCASKLLGLKQIGKVKLAKSTTT